MWRKHVPEPRDVHGHAVLGRRRRPGSPQLVHEALERNDLACSEQQRRDKGELLPAAEVERTIPDLGLERAEDAEPG